MMGCCGTHSVYWLIGMVTCQWCRYGFMGAKERGDYSSPSTIQHAAKSNAGTYKLRRGSTTEAGNRKVDARVVDMNNRWRKFEKAKGRKPSMAMAAHYTEVRLSLPTLLEYSYFWSMEKV